MKLKITPQNTNDEIGHTDYKPEKYQSTTDSEIKSIYRKTTTKKQITDSKIETTDRLKIKEEKKKQHLLTKKRKLNKDP